jgi:hypothetical protein
LVATVEQDSVALLLAQEFFMLVVEQVPQAKLTPLL